MNSILQHRHSFLAGAFAACGSFFGKLTSFLTATHMLEKQAVTGAIWYYLYFLPFVCMIVCNVLNWRYFLKALHSTEQTLTATVLTAATNYMLSFVLGVLVYQEEITLLSSFGATLIVAGLWFLCDVRQTPAVGKSSAMQD